MYVGSIGSFLIILTRDTTTRARVVVLRTTVVVGIYLLLTVLCVGVVLVGIGKKIPSNKKVVVCDLSESGQRHIPQPQNK